MGDSERTHVVRLAVRRSEDDSTDGVHARVEQFLRGGLGRFAHAVDDLGDGVQFFLTPAEYRSFLAALDEAWAGGDATRAG